MDEQQRQELLNATKGAIEALDQTAYAIKWSYAFITIAIVLCVALFVEAVFLGRIRKWVKPACFLEVCAVLTYLDGVFQDRTVYGDFVTFFLAILGFQVVVVGFWLEIRKESRCQTPQMGQELNSCPGVEETH